MRDVDLSPEHAASTGEHESVPDDSEVPDDLIEELRKLSLDDLDDLHTFALVARRDAERALLEGRGSVGQIEDAYGWEQLVLSEMRTRFAPVDAGPATGEIHANSNRAFRYWGSGL